MGSNVAPSADLDKPARRIAFYEHWSQRCATLHRLFVRLRAG
ncbi:MULTISPECIES: hypothetical protein [unclassified Bradyrhizobium]|nr:MULTISPECIES: hypothetical protein [unclassified Bradyrhizobium]